MNLIISDSRGKGLGPIVRKYTEALVYVSVQSGAGLFDSVLRAKPDITRFKPKRIYIISGVNNLTHLNRITRKLILKERDVTKATDNFMQELGMAQHLIHTTTNDCPDIIMAPLTGLSISMYNNDPSVPTADQDILNATVITINKKITEYNEDRCSTTPWTASYIHRYFRRKYHFAYDKLAQDGCHLTEDGKDFWGYKIAIAIDTPNSY